jgi:hypothetical protein
MRTKTYLALSAAALAVASVVVVACSSSSVKCSPGEVDIEVELDQSATLADRIVIFSNTPAATLTVPHTPGDSSLMHVAFTYPTGYPSDQYLEIHLQALGGVTLLGVDIATFHSGKTCSSIMATVSGNLGPDLADVD